MTYGTITYARKLAAENKTALQVWRAVNKAYGPIKFSECCEIVNRWKIHQRALAKWMKVKQEMVL